LSFHIYSDASDHQLGAVIMQDKNPTAFYSRKLNTAQKRYTTIKIKAYLFSAIVTRDLNLLSLTMGANSNVSSNKCVTIMALKPNQLQVTTYHPQANAIIERVHKVVNDILRSFDLENNHENLEEQEDDPYDYFLQSTVWLPSY
jgi:hypothetical protein